MATAQTGIFALGTRTHRQLEFDLRDGVGPADVIAAVQALSESHVTAGGVNLVVGFGAALWGRLSAAPPADLVDFTPIDGLDGHRAAATQHDVWVWLHGTGTDVVHDAAVAVAAVLAPVATLGDDTTCFVYHDSRDLSGFVDGTENPPPSVAPTVALVPDGCPGAGGSHVLAQRWVHDLDAFGRLEVAEQERVVGRRKADSEALPRDVRPFDAHIMRAELLDTDGEERPIYRRSVPWGGVTERGLFFLAFSAERDRFDGMLSRMFGTSGDGLRDRLLDFSRAVTGSFYFAPSLDELRSICYADSDEGPGADGR